MKLGAIRSDTMPTESLAAPKGFVSVPCFSINTLSGGDFASWRFSTDKTTIQQIYTWVYYAWLFVRHSNVMLLMGSIGRQTVISSPLLADSYFVFDLIAINGPHSNDVMHHHACLLWAVCHRSVRLNYAIQLTRDQSVCGIKEKSQEFDEKHSPVIW